MKSVYDPEISLRGLGLDLSLLGLVNIGSGRAGELHKASVIDYAATASIRLGYWKRKGAHCMNKSQNSR
jgi:hypothetical protein